MRPGEHSAPTTLVDVFSDEHTAQAGSSSIDDIAKVTNYVAAINHALDQIHSKRGWPISMRLLNNSHHILMQGVRGGARQLFELLPEHPVISTPVVTKLLETTKPTAGKAIELLEGVGILSEIGQRKRDRLYSYQKYVRLLD